MTGKASRLITMVMPRAETRASEIRGIEDWGHRSAPEQTHFISSVAGKERRIIRTAPTDRKDRQT